MEALSVLCRWISDGVKGGGGGGGGGPRRRRLEECFGDCCLGSCGAGRGVWLRVGRVGLEVG